MSPFRWFSVLVWPLLVVWPAVVYFMPHNVCKTHLGYLGIGVSEDCYYEQDVELDSLQLIEKYTNGHMEVHNLTSLDGYNLTMFRLPPAFGEKSLGPLLLKHPLLSDSAIWLTGGNVSLPLLLWKMGFDVWLGNARGTHYSRQHVNYTVSDYEYWNFSFNEMGLYDIKAEVDHIKTITNQSTIVLGHSMACTSALIYASLLPEEAQHNVKLFILMAPPSSLRNMESPFKSLLGMFDGVQAITETLKIGEVTSFHHPFNVLLKAFGRFSPLSSAFLSWASSVLFGSNFHGSDPALNVFLYAHLLHGFSYKTLFHYGQLMLHHDRFAMYDYGNDGNMEAYGSENPPDYPLENITSPVWIIYGEDDSVVVPQDIEILYNRLPERVRFRKSAIRGFNHGDFHYNIHRHRKLYDEILDVLKFLSSS